jgi:hypothetical protein
MILPPRQSILVGALVLLLAASAAWNVNWMLRQRDDARYASEDLAACSRVAGAIESARGKATMASSEAVGVQELGKRIEAAFSQAGLAQSSLHGVFPQSTRSVGDASYLQKPTTLVFGDVSLPQLATFLYYLTEGSQLSVRDLRLRSPRGGADNSMWDAEATVTYLIYAPSARPREDR